MKRIITFIIGVLFMASFVVEVITFNIESV
jgi:hypothetical protein